MKIRLRCKKTKKVKEEKADETKVTYYYYLESEEGYKVTIRSEDPIQIHREDEFILKKQKAQQEVGSFSEPKAE